MAYEPKTWKCGEKITADALNHMENGIANAGSGDAPFVVNFTNEGGTWVADKTHAETLEAFESGRAVLANAHIVVTQSDVTSDTYMTFPLYKPGNVQIMSGEFLQFDSYSSKLWYWRFDFTPDETVMYSTGSQDINRGSN